MSDPRTEPSLFTDNALKVTDPVRPVVVKQGGPLELSCELSQAGVTDGIWCLNEDVLENSDRVMISVDEHKQFLKIDKVSDGDVGVYSFTRGNTTSAARVCSKYILN